jgi:acetyl-CoA carboxylase carboxyl transferase subunit alpha
LLGLKIIDEVVPEPLGGAHQNHGAAIDNLRNAVAHHLDEICEIPMDTLLEERYAKFRRMGEFA